MLLGRLHQSNQRYMGEVVYGFVLFAMELFAFYPAVRPLIRQRSNSLHLTLTLVLFLTSVVALYNRWR